MGIILKAPKRPYLNLEVGDVWVCTSGSYKIIKQDDTYDYFSKENFDVEEDEENNL